MNSIKEILIIPRKKEVAPRKVSLSPQNVVYFKRKKIHLLTLELIKIFKHIKH